MRRRILLCIALAACNTENKLGNENGNGNGTSSSTGNGTGNGGSTDPVTWSPGTDTPPGTGTTTTGGDGGGGGTHVDRPPETTTGVTPGTDTEGGPGTGTSSLDTGSTSEGTTWGGTIPTQPDTGLTDDEICDRAASLAGYLDAWQTAGDGRVYYCHSSSGTNWVFVESDISSCIPHLNHNYAVFPTTGCDT
jgi:hypothetical protein